MFYIGTFYKLSIQLIGELESSILYYNRLSTVFRLIMISLHLKWNRFLLNDIDIVYRISYILRVA